MLRHTQEVSAHATTSEYHHRHPASPPLPKDLRLLPPQGVEEATQDHHNLQTLVFLLLAAVPDA